LLRRVPGVGLRVNQTLPVDLPELGSLARQQIATLVGGGP